MQRRVTVQELAGIPRGAVLVVVPFASGQEASVLRTVRQLAAHGEAIGGILLVGDDAALDALLAEAVSCEQGPDLLLLARREQAQAGALPAQVIDGGAYDIALLAPGVIVGADWLRLLRAAADDDSTVASATPLALGRGGLDVGRWAAGDGDNAAGLEPLAAAVAAQARPIRPRTSRIGPACVFVKRAALELLPRERGDDGDLGLAPAAELLSSLGLLHVVADDVLVDERGVLGVAEAPHAENADAILDTVDDDHRSPLRRASAVARAAVLGTTVTIDARALVDMHGGTQTYLRQLLHSLAKRDELIVRALLPDDVPQDVLRALNDAGDIETVTYASFLDDPSATDVVHRPQQVFTADDLELMRLAGRRLVIGHQDLIAYHIGAYHPSVDRWRSFRRVTRKALAVADAVVFFSEHARRDAIAEALVSPGRSHVVGIGPPDRRTEAPTERPRALEGDEPFLLCLGADSAHKNRPFAIELLAVLRARGWPGRLVLAGGHVDHGSSRERERDLLAALPGLRDAVVDVGPLSDAERDWCIRHSSAIAYPTLYEGYGLIPLEAAAWGVPCLFAAQASLAEVAAEAATLVPWDPVASAEQAEPLLAPGAARDEHLALLAKTRSPSRDEVAGSLAAIYRSAVEKPPTAAAPRAWEEQRREAYVESLEREVGHLRGVAQEYQDAYHALEERVAEGLPLIDRGGLLTPRQMRGLKRVASRRAGRMLLAPLSLAGENSEAGPGREPPAGS